MNALLPVASAREAWRALARALHAHRPLLVLTVATVVAGALAGVLIPTMVGHIIDLVNEGRPASAVTGPAIVLAVLAMAQGTLMAVGLALVARTGEVVLADLRERVVARAIDLPLDEIERAGAGDVLARVGGDVAVVSAGIRGAVPSLVESGLTVGLTVVALGVLDWRFALAALCAVPIQLLTLRWYLRASSSVYRAEREAAARRAAQLLGSIEGAATVRAFRLGPDHTEQVAERSAENVELGMRAAVMSERFYGRLNLAELVGLASVLTAGFLLVRSGGASVGDATAAALLFHRLFDPINALLGQFDEGQAAAAGLTRLVGVADIPVPAAPPVVAATDASVTVDALGFAYTPGHPVLRNVSFHVAPGERVAVVGATGAGKTTLAKVIAGVHPPSSGAVRVGGADVGALGDGLRRAVALVSQEVHVFTGTVADNLRLARAGASDAELAACLAAVDADWVAHLRDGLDTLVGEGGHRLTSAEAQHLALARLVLADPLVAVLDEATAEAGSVGARLLDAATDRAVAGRTAIVVAHRLSQASRADRIVVLDAGRIVEVGTHDELVAAGGRYADLWRAWHDHRTAGP